MQHLAKGNGGRRIPRLRTTLLLAALLPAFGQAQTINICDRTPLVRDAILKAHSAGDCAGARVLDMKGIESLTLHDDELSEWELQVGDLNGLHGLRRLYLGGDGQLSSLPEGVFEELSSLTHLHADSNQFAALPEGIFQGLDRLTHLDLSYNRLQSLPEGIFQGLGHLWALYLGGNRLADLPEDVFDGMGNLHWLELNANFLTSLPEGVFEGAGNLEVLALQDNYLATLPEGVFTGAERGLCCGRLQELHLEGNRLTTLPEAVFADQSALKALHLHGNRLAFLPFRVFDALSLNNLHTLTLHENHLWGISRDWRQFKAVNPGRLTLGGQTRPPDTPRQPETPDQPDRLELPEPPGGNDGLADDVAALQTRMAAVEAAATKVDALQTRMDGLIGSVDRLAASVDTLRESLGQRVGDLEAEAADAPGSRLLIVPLTQTEETQQEERQ